MDIDSELRNNPSFDALKNRLELADDEELIGVYGIMDYYKSIVALGYVVKVKPEKVFTCPYQIFLEP